ncbi:hypothetical protein ZWY2020_053594 [Hordeum vulgare]|nr:hypothetical protein ZWY2020_053594 [Hordeum vulgare]
MYMRFLGRSASAGKGVLLGQIRERACKARYDDPEKPIMNTYSFIVDVIKNVKRRLQCDAVSAPTSAVEATSVPVPPSVTETEMVVATPPTAAVQAAPIPVPPDTQTVVILDGDHYNLYFILGGIVLVSLAGCAIWWWFEGGGGGGGGGSGGGRVPAELPGLLPLDLPPDYDDKAAHAGDGHPCPGVVFRFVLPPGTSADAGAMGLAAVFGRAPGTPP